MYLPQSYFIAVLLMFISMICWGSWANTTKMDKGWRFELFYWDYSVGVFLTSLLFAFSLGSLGAIEPSFLKGFSSFSQENAAKAFASGAVFNLANICLVAAISIAGMAVAFPVAVGISLVVGTTLSYFISQKGSFLLLLLGIVLILIAIVLAAAAYKRKDLQEKKELRTSKKGLILSVVSGILMSFFYPILADSIQGEGALTPYVGIFFFAVGVLICTVVINYALMRKPILGKPIFMSAYFQGSFKQHLIGLFGGFIWCVGFSFNVIASTNAGPAIAYALGQGATLVAAIWGVFVWKEFYNVKRVFLLLLLMFICYLLGLASIGLAKLFG